MPSENFNEGFIKGAEWRINSVWHDTKTEQAKKKPALVEYSLLNGNFGYLVTPRPDELGNSITRFAYLDDLFPERKDDEV